MHDAVSVVSTFELAKLLVGPSILTSSILVAESWEAHNQRCGSGFLENGRISRATASLLASLSGYSARIASLNHPIMESVRSIFFTLVPSRKLRCLIEVVVSTVVQVIEISQCRRPLHFEFDSFGVLMHPKGKKNIDNTSVVSQFCVFEF